MGAGTTHHSAPRARRRRRWAGLAVALVLAVAGACSDDEASPSTTAPGRAPGESTTTAAPVDPGPPYAVGRRDLTVVDADRGTDARPDQGIEARPDRTIDLTVIYPADGDPGEAPSVAATWDHSGAEDGQRVARADAEPAAGAFPLVVFAHGWNGQGSSFVPLAEQWARAGYVVALPTFPLSRNGIGASDDYVNQPGDISFVIDTLTGEDDGIGPDDPLVGAVDGERIAVGGHSLGSATVFRAAYNACCVDPRIDVTVTVAGGPIDIAEPGYEDQPSTPMLLAHGAADPGVPVAVSDAMVDFVQAPVTYLRFTDGDHTSVFVGDEGELFSAAVVAFLDARLRDDPEALDALPDTVAASGLAELRTG